MAAGGGVEQLHSRGAGSWRGQVPFAEVRKLESVMNSKLALQQKEAVFRAVRQLTPEQRLNAFLTHCRLVTCLYRAGAVQRTTNRRQGP